MAVTQEQEQAITQMLARMTPEQKDRAFLHSGGYEQKPVDINTFIDDPEFLGGYFDGVDYNPYWRRVMNEIYPNPYHSPFWLVALKGSIGRGKTTTACTGIAYDAYRLLCEINPQKKAGLIMSTILMFAIFNVTKRLGSDVMVQLEDMFASSRWFQSKIDPSRFKTGHHYFLNKSIDFRVGSRISHTLGKAIYEAILDESEFEIVTDQIYKNFNSLLRRIQTRFGTGFPGRIWVVSSEGEKFSVINKIVDSYRGDPGIYVDSSALWEVMPEKTPIFHDTGETFPVFKGTTDQKPHIITAEADPVQTLHPDRIIQVPIDLRNTFDADIYASLRDLAGEPIVSKYRLFNQPDRLNKALIIKPIFPSVFKIDFYDEHDLIQNYALLPGYFKNRMAPHLPRHIHIDIGVTGDRFGFACGFIAGFKERSFLDPTTLTEVSQSMPDVVCEFGFAIECKPGQQIPFYKVRAFIQHLAALGVPVNHVSCDGFQSTDMLQQMELIGYGNSVQSVDRTSEPYVRLRNAVHEGLFSGPKDHLLRSELSNLELTPDGKKVDHPDDKMDRIPRPEGEEGDEEYPHPSKDYSDAVAGMHTTLVDRATDYVLLYLEPEPAYKAVDEKTVDFFWGPKAKTKGVTGV